MSFRRISRAPLPLASSLQHPPSTWRSTCLLGPWALLTSVLGLPCFEGFAGTQGKVSECNNYFLGVSLDLKCPCHDGWQSTWTVNNFIQYLMAWPSCFSGTQKTIGNVNSNWSWVSCEDGEKCVFNTDICDHSKGLLDSPWRAQLEQFLCVRAQWGASFLSHMLSGIRNIPEDIKHAYFMSHSWTCWCFCFL